MTTTTRPVITFTSRFGKDGLAAGNGNGWKTEKGTARTVADLSSYSSASAYRAEDGLFYVQTVAEVLPAAETAPCTDCGQQVDVMRAGDGDPTYERCPVNVDTMFRGHRVPTGAWSALREYRSAERALARGDRGYALKEA